MKRELSNLKVVIAVSTMVAGGSPLVAQSINYGDFEADSVTFRTVDEVSGTDPTPLYGAPVTSGNSLDFDPITFTSFSAGSAADLTDGALRFFVDADEGSIITDIDFSERGDYSLFDLAGGPTTAAVNNALFLSITEVDGIAIDPIDIFDSGVFIPDDGIFSLDSPGLVVADLWESLAAVSVADALLASGVPFEFGATGVRVAIDNTLLTSAGPSGVAFVAKKDLVVTVDTAAIPEPYVVANILLGGLVLIMRRRRFRKA